MHLAKTALLLLGTVSALAAVNWAALLAEEGAAGVRFGVALKGKEPWSLRELESFAPASVSKLFTAGAALDALGENFRYTTSLAFTQTAPGTAANLLLTGSGDPSWGLSEFGESPRARLDAIATALKNEGISTVVGEPQLAPTDPRWSMIEFPSGWKVEDAHGCGGALAQAFNVGANCGQYKISSASRGGWETEGLAFPVVLALRSGTSNSYSVRLEKSARGLRFVLSGTWKTGSAAETISLPVYDTLPWARALFRNALVAKGIRLVPARRPEKGLARELLFPSPELQTLLKPFLKNSVNFLGDALVRTLGARSRPEGAGLLAPGLSALSAYLIRLGLPPGSFTLNDGSGLSRTSRTTPASVLRFLELEANERHFPAFYAALAVAGVDGTLRNRMKGGAAEGQLRGKTGTLDGVYNLAGYVPRVGAKAVPFVLLTRTTSDLSAPARRAEDRVGTRLAELHHSVVAAFEPAPEPFPYVPEHAGLDDQ